MSAISTLAASAAALVLVCPAPGAAAPPVAQPASDDSIRPFRIQIPEAALVDLRRRIAATRWPERETVTDQSQGVQLARIKPLVDYWGSDPSSTTRSPPGPIATASPSGC